MKEEWKQFLDSLPYRKTELHKDEFKRKYKPEDLQLPVIMVSDGATVQLLLSAQEINRVKSLDEMIRLVSSKLTK